MGTIKIQSRSPISHCFSVFLKDREHCIVIPGINSLPFGHTGDSVIEFEIDSDAFEAILKKHTGSPLLGYYSVVRPKIVPSEPVSEEKEESPEVQKEVTKEKVSEEKE